jgi:hypothetical protein
MRIGMLWFDDSQERDLVTKIDRAARHYEAKYGLRPSLCYVHPSSLLGKGLAVPGIDVKGTNVVLPNHFWLGRSEELEQQQPAA